jgi:hypothetical protein
MLGPSACSGQLLGTATAAKGGEQEAEDCTEPLLLGSQAAFALGAEVVGQAQVREGVVEGFEIALGLSLLAFAAFLGMQATPCDGLSLFSGVSFGWGHGEFLRTVC